MKIQTKAERIKKIIAEKVTGKILPKHDEHGHHYLFVETGTIRDSVTTINGILSKEHLLWWSIRKGIEWLERENRFERLKIPEERDALIKGAQFAYTEIRDDAGNVGTQAHNAIEFYLKQWMITGIRPVDIRLFFKREAGKNPFNGYYLEEHDTTIIETDLRAIAAARAVENLMNKHDIYPLASEILVGDERYSAGTLDFLCLWNGELSIVDWKTSNSIDDIGYPMQISAYMYFFQKMTGLKIKNLRLSKLSKDMDKFENFYIPSPKLAYDAFKDLANFYHSWGGLKKDQRITKFIKVTKI